MQADVTDLYAYEARQLALPLAQSAAADTDVREVFNYVQALEYGQERLSTLPVSLRLIREVHDILMKGVRGEFATPGEFRHTQNWIGRPGGTLDDATYVIPQTQKLLGITYRSAANNVQKLVNAGILREAEATPQGRAFVARDILRAVAETT